MSQEPNESKADLAMDLAQIFSGQYEMLFRVGAVLQAYGAPGPCITEVQNATLECARLVYALAEKSNGANEVHH